MTLLNKVYMVDIYGNGREIKLYKGKQGWSYYKNQKGSKLYIGEVYDWTDVTEQEKNKGKQNDPYR